MDKQIEVVKTKKKRILWNEASEAALLDMWPSKMDGLRGQRKNGHIYSEMADELNQQGYFCSPRDIQVKLQNFTQRYRKEKAAMGVSGGSPSPWVHYATVHQIIGGFKANTYTELTLESIDAIESPSTPLSAPSSPLSPSPSSSSTVIEPAKKKRKFDFRETVLNKFDSISKEITEHLKKSDENERELIEHERKLIEIERKKAETLERIANDNKELNTALILFLNKN